MSWWRRGEAKAAEKDPICGMNVDPGRAAGKSERDGKTYYSCSPNRKARFDAASA